MGIHFSEPPANHNTAYFYDISDLSEWQEDDTHILNIQPTETHSLDWSVTHAANSSHTHTLVGAKVLDTADTLLAHTVPVHTHGADVQTHTLTTQTPPPGVYNSSVNTLSHPHTVVLPSTGVHMLDTHDTQVNSPHTLPSPTHSSLVWCESPVYTSPGTDDEVSPDTHTHPQTHTHSLTQK